MDVGATVFLSLHIPHEGRVLKLDIAGIVVELQSETAFVAVPSNVCEALQAPVITVAPEVGDVDIDIGIVSLPVRKLVVSRPAGWSQYEKFPSGGQLRPQLRAASRALAQARNVEQSSDDQAARIEELESRLRAFHSKRRVTALPPSSHPQAAGSVGATSPTPLAQTTPSPSAGASRLQRDGSTDTTGSWVPAYFGGSVPTASGTQPVPTRSSRTLSGQHDLIFVDPDDSGADQGIDDAAMPDSAAPAQGPTSQLNPADLQAALAQLGLILGGQPPPTALPAAQTPMPSSPPTNLLQAPKTPMSLSAPAQSSLDQAWFPQYAVPQQAAPTGNVDIVQMLQGALSGGNASQSLQAPLDVSQMLQLATLQLLQKQSSSLGSLGTQNVLTKAFNAYEDLKLKRTQEPLTIVRDFRDECIGKLRPRPNETWRYLDVWKLDRWDQSSCRTAGRFAYLLGEMIEDLDRGEVATAHATAVLAYRACRQFRLDGNSWKAAWLLTAMEDPFSQSKWGGTPHQLAVIGGYLKAEAELKDRVKEGSFAGAATLSSEKDEDANAQAPAPKTTGRPPRNRNPKKAD